MKEMIVELSANAIFVMNGDMEAGLMLRTSEAIVDILKKSKFGYMPFYLVLEGFQKGSMGELGGTTKFTVRNVCVWMNAMYDRLTQINAEKKSKEDAERRALEANKYKSEQKRHCLYGSAMLKKIEWCHDGAITTSEEYDRLSLDKIVAAMQKGYNLKDLHPSMII